MSVLDASSELVLKLSTMSAHIDGREAITTMKSRGSRNWRQMEWFGFFMEEEIESLVAKNPGWGVTMPGPEFANTEFDLGVQGVAGDIKSHINTNAKGAPSHISILNDMVATDRAIEAHHQFPLIVINMDAVFDHDGSFKQWHDEFKGDLSSYVRAGNETGRRVRMRKSAVTITSIALYVLDKDSIETLSVHVQGKNSNGKPRPDKYLLDDRDLTPKLEVFL